VTITDISQSAVVNASGNAVITIASSNRNPWVVFQVSVEVTYKSGCRVQVKKGAFVVTPIILETASGSGTAAGDPPVKLLSSETLTVNYTGLTAGTTVKAYIIYDDGN
jgi:hypothetical protein